jgi:glutathione S-transferase
MTSYRLHYFPESGNSYKLALMLTLCGQSFEPVWTDFGGGVTRTPEWRATVNEMGEIPVLEEDGVRFTQTAPILLQLADRYRRFGGKSAQKFEILRWLFWDNHKLTGKHGDLSLSAYVHPGSLRAKLSGGTRLVGSHGDVTGSRSAYHLLPGKHLVHYA